MTKQIKKKTTKKTTAKKSTNNKVTSTKKSTNKRTTKSASKTTSTKVLKKRTKVPVTDGDKQLLQVIIEGMQEKKAHTITVMDLQNIENCFCNYFVICEAESKPQLQAITDSVQEFTQKKLSIKPHHIEGLENAEWILIDYLTIVAHVFRSDIRAFYKLEELWADAKIQYI